MGVHSAGLNLGVSLGENTIKVLDLNSFFSRYPYFLLEDASRVRESRKGPRLQGRLHHLPRDEEDPQRSVVQGVPLFLPPPYFPMC